jgi:ribonuclease BN (tRNA processing enzyme)
MKLTILGSGTTVPHPKRRSSGYWLETGSGTVLLDCSMYVPRQMVELELDWPHLDAIWISHFHLDHVGGLAPFLSGTKHAEEMRKRAKPLHIFGPAGLKDLLEAFDDAGNYKLFKQPFPLEVIEVEPLDTFQLVKGIDAVAMKTPHNPRVLPYIFATSTIRRSFTPRIPDSQNCSPLSLEKSTCLLSRRLIRRTKPRRNISNWPKQCILCVKPAEAGRFNAPISNLGQI